MLWHIDPSSYRADTFCGRKIFVSREYTFIFSLYHIREFKIIVNNKTLLPQFSFSAIFKVFTLSSSCNALLFLSPKLLNMRQSHSRQVPAPILPSCFPCWMPVALHFLSLPSSIIQQKAVPYSSGMVPGLLTCTGSQRMEGLLLQLCFTWNFSWAKPMV